MTTSTGSRWRGREHTSSAAGAILSAVAGVTGACVLALAFALGLDPEGSAGEKPWLDLAGLIVLGSGLSAVYYGLRAWAREEEHSAPVVAAIVAGGLLAALAGQQLLTGLGTFAG